MISTMKQINIFGDIIFHQVIINTGFTLDYTQVP